jgi:hypothetical protein
MEKQVSYSIISWVSVLPSNSSGPRVTDDRNPKAADNLRRAWHKKNRGLPAWGKRHCPPTMVNYPALNNNGMWNKLFSIFGR